MSAINNEIGRRSALAAGMSAVLAGCSNTRMLSTDTASASRADGLSDPKPLDLAIPNLTKITVCLRPFRTSGPRLETEAISGKTVLHHYGHGGSGWSLAWGYAEAARAMLANAMPDTIAIVGAGAIGLTTAIAMAETGAKVTVFARDMPDESSSSRASGVWSPSSRIGFANAVEEDFAERWEWMARRSYQRHLQYVGRLGNPVEFTPRYYIRAAAPEPPLADSPEGGQEFVHLGRILRASEPPWSEREVHPFPTQSGVRGGLVMTFNIAEYTRQLTEDFLAMGGRIVRAEIGSIEELADLPGRVVVNCAGYGAKILTGDRALIPVRGQIAWMAPQSDRLYGIFHRNVMALSRRDGLLIQETGGSDYFGFGEDDKTPRRDEFLAARSKIAPLFEWN